MKRRGAGGKVAREHRVIWLIICIVVRIEAVLEASDVLVADSYLLFGRGQLGVESVDFGFGDLVSVLESLVVFGGECGVDDFADAGDSDEGVWIIVDVSKIVDGVASGRRWRVSVGVNRRRGGKAKEQWDSRVGIRRRRTRESKEKWDCRRHREQKKLEKENYYEKTDEEQHGWGEFSNVTSAIYT